MDSLSWAKAHKKTAFGEVAVDWSREEKRICLQIPRGLTAKCCFPAVCSALKNSQTGQQYLPNETGFFDFTVDAGQWELVWED